MPVLTIGSIRLDLLLDAEITVPGDAVFSPASREQWVEFVIDDGAGNLRVPVRPLLISAPDGHTLVDTGFGGVSPLHAESEPQGRTVEELAARSISPEDIQRVIITHAHGDHILGNTRQVDGKPVATYPNAEYVIQKVDVENLRETSREMWTTYFEPIEKSGKLRLIDGDTRLTDSITCRLTRGHTIGHQSVVISSTGESACYLGDLAIRTLNIERLEWSPDWAWSREEDIRNRTEIRDWAKQTGAILILLHDADHPFVRVEDRGGKTVITDVRDD